MASVPTTTMISSTAPAGKSLKDKARLNHGAFLSSRDCVAVTSFPRSGSNWLCLMLSEMLHLAAERSQTAKATGRRGYVIRNLDSSDFLFEEEQGKADFSGVVKTHRFFTVPENKIIYIFRDPRDVLASLRNWHRKMEPWQECNGWNDFRYLRCFLPLLNCHLADALQYRFAHKDKIFLASYESMLSAPLGPLKSLTRFMGMDLSDEDLLGIYGQFSIGNMKSTHSTLVYRAGEAKKGRGDFSPWLLALVWAATSSRFRRLKALAP